VTDRYDVIIAGYGPVGQVAANLLGQRGFRVAVFEAATRICDLPRAAHFDGEIMRVFQYIGLAEAVLPACAAIRGMKFLNAERELLFGFEAADRRTNTGWYAGYMFYQPDLEAALQHGAQRFAEVHVFPGHEVLDIKQDDGGVEARVRNLASGDERSVRGDWLWGCDGARSATRRAAAIDLEDLVFDQPWLVIDTMLKRETPLPDFALQICDPARPTTFIPSAGKHRRWEFMLMPGEDPAEMELHENVWRLLSDWVCPEDTEVVRAVVYSFHALIAHSYRSGRLFILGDAAHQMPPFLGQGMCAGIRDAANLAWKLDLVRHGLAGNPLLDTYYDERAAHVRTIIGRAVQAGRLIQTTDPTVAEARDRMFLAGAERMHSPDAPGGELDIRMPGLTGGLLSRTGVGSAAGDIFPQTLVERDGRPLRLDDALGEGFAIIAGPDDARVLSEAAQEAWAFLSPSFVHVQPPTAGGRPGENALTVRDREGFVLDWLRANGVAVVRPDRYVYGAAHKADDLIAMAAAMRKQLGARSRSGVPS